MSACPTWAWAGRPAPVPARSPIERSTGRSARRGGSRPCARPTGGRDDGENVVVTRVTSGGDGHFTVDLPPGDYVLAPETGQDSYPIAQPQSVTVVGGQYAEVEINYDTGIR